MTSSPSPAGSVDARRVAFLGPVGTFTEQALHREAGLAAGELVPMATMADVLFAVNEGDVDAGVVPIENAIEGTVNATIDTLAFDVDLVIQRELVEPVSMHLLVPPGSPLDGVRVIHSIPVATAQCRAWLRANLPDAEVRPANSTAEAAAICARTASVSGASTCSPPRA